MNNKELFIEPEGDINIRGDIITSNMVSRNRFDTSNLDFVDGNVKHFGEILSEMLELYSRKNRDYGNSFDKSLDEDGLLVAKIRMGDKLSRFSQILKRKGLTSVADESIRDTLIDLSNYAAMTVKWIDSLEE